MRHVDQRLLGVLPEFRRADVLVAVRIADADAHPVIVQAERLEHEDHQLQIGDQFALDLIGRHEQVGVVLGEAADAGHAAEFARLLEAIDGAEFREPDRQIAIAVRRSP